MNVIECLIQCAELSMMKVPRVLNPDYSTLLLKKMLILHRQALFMLNIERSTVVCELVKIFTYWKQAQTSMECSSASNTAIPRQKVGA